MDPVTARVAKYWPFVAGISLMIGAFLFDLLTRSEDVPNDANIGAGLLFMAGVGLLVVGVVLALLNRMSSRT